MKRAVSILMVLLFLLNTLGMYGVYLGLQIQNAQSTNDQLDQDRYSGSDALTFKVPIAIPYATDNDEYIRVTGEFEHNGEMYRLVKQKLYQDTLYVVCVKDKEGKEIHQAMEDYVKSFTDKPTSAKNQNSKSTLPTFIKDYLTTGITVEFQASGWNEDVCFNVYCKNYASLRETRIKYPPKPFLS